MSEINFAELRKAKKTHGFARGGRVKPKHEDAAEDRKIAKEEIAKAKSKGEMKTGGEVHGKKAPKRLDKFARGGKVKHHKAPQTKVNVVVVGGKGEDGASKQPLPIPTKPMMPPPPAGGPVPPMKRGGRAYKCGGKVKK